MASIRIDNFSGDTVTVILNDEEVVVEDSGRASFESLPKGKHALRVHRTRVPCDSGEGHEDESEGKFPFKTDKTMHTQLDLIAQIDLNSSKAVVAVKSEATAQNKFWIDAIFSSYCVCATGAVIESERKIFANAGVKKSFVSHHVKSALFPVTLVGLLIFVRGLLAVFSAVGGNPSNIGGMVFTTPLAVALTAVGTAFVGYGIFCVAKILKIAKKLRR